MNRQAFASEFIQDTQRFEEATIRQPIIQDVVSPDVIAICGLVRPVIATTDTRLTHACWLYGKSLWFHKRPARLNDNWANTATRR